MNTTILVINPFNGDSKKILVQSGEYTKFQSGTKMTVMNHTSCSFKIADKILIKYKDTIAKEKQFFDKDAIASYNTGTIFGFNMNADLLFMNEVDLDVKAPITRLRSLGQISDDEKPDSSRTRILAGTSSFTQGTKVTMNGPTTITY